MALNAHTRRREENFPVESEKVHLQWKEKLGSEDTSVGIYFDGARCVVLADHTLASFDEKGGNQWKRELKATAPILAGNERFLAIAAGQRLMVLSHEGNIDGKFTFPGRISHLLLSPKRSEIVVLAAITAANRPLYRLCSCASSGVVEFTRDLKHPPLGLHIVDDTIVTAYASGVVHHFTQKGELRNRIDLKSKLSAFPSAKPLVFEGEDKIHFFLDGWRELHAVDLRILSVSEEEMLFSRRGRFLCLYHFRDGFLWEVLLPEKIRDAGLYAERILVLSEGGLHAFSLADGSHRFSMEIEGGKRLFLPRQGRRFLILHGTGISCWELPTPRRERSEETTQKRQESRNG